MIAGSIVKIATGMTVIKTTVIEMSATATIAMNVTVKKGDPFGGRGHVLLPVAEKMIVAPGRLRLGRIMKIKGLQGTMIDGGAMMTEEVLTLIMIVAGTTAGMIAVATKRKNASRTGLPDTMGTVGGVKAGVEWSWSAGQTK